MAANKRKERTPSAADGLRDKHKAAAIPGAPAAKRHSVANQDGAGPSSDAAGALLADSGLLNPPQHGALRNAITECLDKAGNGRSSQEQRLGELLAAFASIKKGFPGEALQRAVEKRPELLSAAEPAHVKALLALLARSCLLPGRVVELVADNPSVLTDLRIDELEGRIAHLKAETTPMGSQLAALWQKFPQSLWMDVAAVDKRLEWLRQLGVPNDRIRFMYARVPVFTADLASFAPQLDLLKGWAPEGKATAVGALVADKPHYLEMDVARLRGMKSRLQSDLGA